MSVVIVGGNERMAAQYEGICKEHGCKAKVFTKENGSLKRKLEQPRPADSLHQHGFPQDGD